MANKNNLNYDEVAKNIIANIGGKENINSVRHCITRVRFRLKDESKANDDIVKNLEGVLSVVHGGGEYMTVIGVAVEDVYNAVCIQLGMENGIGNEVGNEVEKEEGKKVNPAMRVLNMIVGAVGPCLNMICAGGIIKGLQTILQMTGIIQSGSGLDSIVSAMGDAIFFFLPIFLGMNLAKTLKGDGFLGALIGAILCYPTINGVSLELFGQTINTTYTSSFLPVIAVTAAAVPLSRWLNKYIPKVIANFVTPVITLAVVIPLGFALIGPAVNMAGSMVNAGITALLNTAPLLAGIVFSALYQVMVLFGIHSALTSFSFMSLLEGNPDAIMAMSCLVCFAQIGVVLGMYCKTKDGKLKSIALPAFISGIFGITEPAIYGVTLPRIKMFILSCFSAGITGAIIMLTGTKMYGFGLGIFAVLGMVNPENPNFIPPLLAAVLPFAVSFIIAYVLHKDEILPVSDPVVLTANQTEQVVMEDKITVDRRIVIEAPVAGKIVPISQVPDETFSSGILGNGFAVEPCEGKVYAPFDGICVTIFETLHAMGLESNTGVSLLIHVGLETVGLHGKPFKAHVKNGDRIKKGQLLLEFDIEEIKAAGCPVITPILVANESEVGKVTIEDNKIVIGGQYHEIS